MSPRFHLAVCKGPDCRLGGSDALYRATREEARTLGVGPELCEVARGGCYGLCHLGPNVVLREVAPGAPPDPMRRGDYQLLGVPGEFHYWHMDVARIARVLAEHVLGGKPAVDLVCPASELPDGKK